jgi:hypothetical protein
MTYDNNMLIIHMLEIAPELYVYRINEDLVLEWLVKKVDVLVNNPVFIKHFEKSASQYKKGEQQGGWFLPSLGTMDHH